MDISPVGQQERPPPPFRFPQPAEGRSAGDLTHDAIHCAKAYARGYELQGEVETLNNEVGKLRKSLAEKNVREDEVTQAQRILAEAKKKEDAEHKRWLKQYHAAGKYKGITWIGGVTASLAIAGLAAGVIWEKHKHEAAPEVSHGGGS